MNRTSFLAGCAIAMFFLIMCFPMLDGHNRAFASGVRAQTTVPVKPGGAGTWVYCSGAVGKTDYFSAIYYATGDQYTQVDTMQDTIAYAKYLQEKYSYVDGPTHPGIGCPSFGRTSTVQDAQASKDKLQADMKRQGFQIVETGWKNTAPRVFPKTRKAPR